MVLVLGGFLIEAMPCLPSGFGDLAMREELCGGKLCVLSIELRITPLVEIGMEGGWLLNSLARWVRCGDQTR